MTTATKSSLANPAALNNWQNDFTNNDAVRVSCPLYIDVPQQLRKDLYSKLRSTVETEKIISTPKSQSGITVATATPGGTRVEAAIGVSLDNLRSIMFSRGGLDVSLLLRIQCVLGEEVVTTKDIETALKNKISQVKEFIEINQPK